MMGDDPLFTTVFSSVTKAGSGAEISTYNHFSLTFSRFRDQEAQWEQTVEACLRLTVIFGLYFKLSQ